MYIHGSNIDSVTKFKLLGVFIGSDLSWDSRVTYMLQKVAKQMYCIIYLAKAGVPVCDILCAHCTVSRSILIERLTHIYICTHIFHTMKH